MSKKLRTAVAAAAAAATITTSANAQETIPPEQPVKSVVLVHGAFADGSGWRGVYDILTARGYRVSIVQNPLTSLADDVAATDRILDRQDGPAILVGHSYGGTVITEAGINPKVAGLVYVSALAPDVGETTGGQFADIPAPPEFIIETGDDGFGFVNLEEFKTGFAGDTADADAAFLRDSQVPINMDIFGTPVKHAAWKEKPSWAVIATEDNAIDPKLLRHTADRIGAVSIDVPGSHVVFLTKPDEVADVIDEAARASGGS
ncbi:MULTISPECIES: alpha/beta fold hydrolase [Roseovarius]|uniref:alpha/beta fold hydrolase n=1 Tax=Roseovarius TaxID=74030 RepID=UPI001C968C4E|nr:alpha/beta hydrolase [Roseovarius atlanticus]MBY5987807.1 alpha/beta hydrolase [Roseovarius atlanticus]MBY6123198.1 alpha/beta hydrolase [Roseovarius atlanticus]MBY6147694.1 alpha/beta hydrolase [Roseovarius atlanticus]